MPLIIRNQHRTGVSTGGAFLLGSVWALFSWLASENLSSGLLTFLLVLIVLWSLRAVPSRVASIVVHWFFAGFFSAWCLFVAAFHGFGTFPAFVSLYFRPTRLIPAGFSNTPWTEGSRNPWFLPYVLTPYLYIVTGIAV